MVIYIEIFISNKNIPILDPLGHKTEFLKNLQQEHSIGMVFYFNSACKADNLISLCSNTGWLWL